MLLECVYDVGCGVVESISWVDESVSSGECCDGVCDLADWAADDVSRLVSYP